MDISNYRKASLLTKNVWASHEVHRTNSTNPNKKAFQHILLVWLATCQNSLNLKQQVKKFTKESFCHLITSHKTILQYVQKKKETACSMKEPVL